LYPHGFSTDCLDEILKYNLYYFLTHHINILIRKRQLAVSFSQQSLFPSKDNVSWWDNIYDHESSISEDALRILVKRRAFVCVLLVKNDATSVPLCTIKGCLLRTVNTSFGLQ